MAYAVKSIIVKPILHDKTGKQPSTPELRFHADAIPVDFATFNTTVEAPAINALNKLVALTNSTARTAYITIEYEDTAQTAVGTLLNTDAAYLSVNTVDGSGNPDNAVVTIRNPADGIFLSATGSGANVVDINDADLLAYLALFDDSTGILQISDGEKIQNATPIDSGRRKTKK